jgi:hypothetical protein
MATPQHKLGEAFLDEMRKLGAHFDCNPETGFLIRTVRNTGLIVDALSRAADKHGFPMLSVFLDAACEREEQKVEPPLPSTLKATQERLGPRIDVDSWLMRR